MNDLINKCKLRFICVYSFVWIEQLAPQQTIQYAPGTVGFGSSPCVFPPPLPVKNPPSETYCIYQDKKHSKKEYIINTGDDLRTTSWS